MSKYSCGKVTPCYQKDIGNIFKKYCLGIRVLQEKIYEIQIHSSMQYVYIVDYQYYSTLKGTTDRLASI